MVHSNSEHVLCISFAFDCTMPFSFVEDKKRHSYAIFGENHLVVYSDIELNDLSNSLQITVAPLNFM